jgi:membrane associated rhomboid family serine protease
VFPIKDNIPTDRFPFVTVALIVANVVVYLLAVRHGGSIWSGPDTHEVLKYGAIPYSITHSGPSAHGPHITTIPAWQTIFTSMFMHGSLLHLAGNMLFLWIFGNTLEDSMGSLKFTCFYLVGGIATLAVQVAVEPNSAAPIIGAGGAIAAVIGGYTVLYRMARVLTFVVMILFVTVIEVPALVMVALWFVVQALFAAADLITPAGGSGLIAYLAQVGGFAFGAATIKLLATNIKRVPPRIPVY